MQPESIENLSAHCPIAFIRSVCLSLKVGFRPCWRETRIDIRLGDFILHIYISFLNIKCIDCLCLPYFLCNLFPKNQFLKTRRFYEFVQFLATWSWSWLCQSWARLGAPYYPHILYPYVTYFCPCSVIFINHWKVCCTGLKDWHKG